MKLAILLPLLLTTASLAETTLQQHAAAIDRVLETHWQVKKVTPNPPASDETFLRRIYLDLAGRIPTTAEARQFLNSSASSKRSALIDELLQRESYASHFFNVWADVLRFKTHYVNTSNVIPSAYRRYIRESLRDNKPYDVFVREMLSAKGYAWDNPAIGYYQRDPDMPLDNMALTSRIFLGTRIECAQCHNDPFDKWLQTDFYQLAAYTHANKSVNEAFEGARVEIKRRQDLIEADFKAEKKTATDGGKVAEARKQQRLDDMHYRPVVGVIKNPVGQLLSPIGLNRKADSVLKLPHDFKEDDGKPFDVMMPASLMGEAASITVGQDSAEAFANWVTSPKNPRFTRVIVNRLWRQMLGLPVAERFDNLRDDTKAMIPELEEHLIQLMITLRYDMKAFLGTIARTRVYQAQASSEAHSLGSVYHFPGPLLRRMSAEQVWDSLVALISHDPDARDTQREFNDARRVGISQMVCDAYLAFDGKKLVDIAYEALGPDMELQAKDAAIMEEMTQANRTKDDAKVLTLRHAQGDIRRERATKMVEKFIKPVLNGLAEQKGVQVFEDTLYKINPNPGVLVSETWRRMWLPGYGPKPATEAELKAVEAQKVVQFTELAQRLQIPAEKQNDFITHTKKILADWHRASELDSPAPRGHPLRTLGQSDRDFVENANLQASIPQALMLMNNEIMTDKALLSPWSPLMLNVTQATTADRQLEAAYLALLSRKPTAEEKALCAARKLTCAEDTIHALLNTKAFLFIE
ncbi:MAG: DUF1549 domain-containing protein [Prosthecobacter sp.]|uniref:DUF1549 domain-containing protein n=1 Tax=Prosthecobacter sp. TaxID=1965333 RepID=UPI003900D0A3